MAMQLSEINKRIKTDPRGFVEECEARYGEAVFSAARKIAERIDMSCVVLLSGPSGSGKTTTALKLEDALSKLGVGSVPISLDDYFRTVEYETAPKDEKGNIDYESPDCIDIPLLDAHIKELIAGGEVYVPKFDFKSQSRSEVTVPLRLKKNEIVIFEGIHALNDKITSSAGERGTKLYISARENFYDRDELFFKGTWTRLTRRLVRDNLFRGASAEFTLPIWDNIRKGEKRYISPFRDRADIIINSTHGYEMNVLKKHLKNVVGKVPEGIPRYHEILELLANSEAFCDLSDSFVPKDSLLREFIGGGNFRY